MTLWPEANAKEQWRRESITFAKQWTRQRRTSLLIQRNERKL